MACVAQVRHLRLIPVAVSRRQLVLIVNFQWLELVVLVLILVDVFYPPVKTVLESQDLKVGKMNNIRFFLSKSHADESMIRALFSQSANKCFSYLMHIFYKLAIENCCCNERYQNINLDQQCMKSEVIAAFLVNS